MVPNGWERTCLNDVATRVSVGLATSVTEAYTVSGIPIIRNLNIKKGYFDDSKMLYLDEDFSSKHPNKRVRAGDVITVHTGSNVGLTCVVPENYDLAQTFTTLIVTPKKGILDSWFLNYVINSDYGEYQALRLVVGGGKGNLNTADFKLYPLLLPPLPEQQKIARILSTWDKTISTTEALIDNSKQQKKALMQQLLTGKKRFPGFEEEWEKLGFGEVVSITAKKYNPANNENCLPCVELEHISQETGRIIGSAKGSSLSSIKNHFSSGNVIFGKLRPYLKKYARPTFDGVCSTEIWVFKVNSKLLEEYLFHLVQTDIFISEANKSAGSKMPRADWNLVSQFVIKLPNLDEQQEIATVLTNADREIELLEQQLADLKQEKKALMQQLLTGKRRVKIDEAEVA